MNEESKIGYYAVIPSTVLFNEELKSNEKLLYAVITALANKEGYCYASNNYLADLFNSKAHTISNWISHLNKLNFVYVDLIRNKFPKLQNSTINNIKKDISWVLDYKYSDGKTSKELLEMVENVLIDGKTQTMSKNGKDMTWKNKVYIDINVNEIIDLISKHIR